MEMGTPTRDGIQGMTHTGVYGYESSNGCGYLDYFNISMRRRQREPYNAVAAYGACQVDALQGLHYPINGDCPNWQAWKARRVQVQSSPRGRVYSTSRSTRHLNQ